VKNINVNHIPIETSKVNDKILIVQENQKANIFSTQCIKQEAKWYTIKQFLKTSGSQLGIVLSGGNI
jgi:hypothetical protein